MSVEEYIGRLEINNTAYRKAIKNGVGNLANTYHLLARNLMNIAQVTNQDKKPFYLEAISAHTSALEKAPNDPVYLVDRATCYIALNMLDKAREDYELAEKHKDSMIRKLFRLYVDIELEKLRKILV